MFKYSNVDEFRDHFVYAPSQWGTTLHCSVVSHWLGAYTKYDPYELYITPAIKSGVISDATCPSFVCLCARDPGVHMATGGILCACDINDQGVIGVVRHHL